MPVRRSVGFACAAQHSSIASSILALPASQPFISSASGGVIMQNDFTNHKGKKLFCKLWIKFGSRRELAETGHLLRLSDGIRRRQVVPRLQDSNLLRTSEALRQHVDDRGIYIVDTVAYILKLGHDGGETDISQLRIRLLARRHDGSKRHRADLLG